MRRISRHPEEQALRYDYALAHESLIQPKAAKRRWQKDYELSLFEKLMILFALCAPAIAVWWRLG